MIQHDDQHDQHTDRQTDRQTEHGMHGIMWCDERRIHSTAERGLSASLSGPMARRADCRWLTQPTDRCLLNVRTACSVSLFALSLARLLACLLACLLAYPCLCLLACHCIRAHCWLFAASADCLHGRMAETALWGWKWLLWASWRCCAHACMMLECLQWP